MKKIDNKNEVLALSSKSDFLIYNAEDDSVKVDVLLIDENIWLTQTQIAELFGKSPSTINEHLKNIYKEGELKESETMRKFGNSEFSTKPTNFYNLDAIISVGYRANSHRATMFRIWATNILKEYIIKGFAMNDERLKTPNRIFGQDYFDEQLERIKNIRSSERRFYQKITDIYAECSADYDVNDEMTKQFYATVQNKLHFAIAHQTAAEIIYTRANAEKEHMGLTTWKNAPKGRIIKSDVSIAKNYLSEEELQNLNNIVSMYLDYAELQAKKHQVMYMEDWVKKLNAFLQFNEYDLLQNNGKVTAELAKEFAESEFEKYRIVQDRLFQSDFDKLLLEIKNDEDKK